MSIGSRIKQRREELGYTQPQLATLLGVSKGTVGNYESGISSPNENILFRLFDVLKCDANFLYQDDINILKTNSLSSVEQEHIGKYRHLDTFGKRAVDLVLDVEYDRCQTMEQDNIIELPQAYSKASAGLGDLLDSDDFDMISVKATPEAYKADIAIIVDGDSMLPLYQNGDLVLVRRQPDVEIGEIGIFTMNNTAYIKKKGERELISINPAYDNIVGNEFSDFRCYGKVIGKAEVVK